MKAELRTIGMWVAVLSLVAAVVAVVLQLQQDDSDQQHVADCREEHGVPQAPEDSTFAQGEWADCSWPPPDGAEADGLGRIQLNRVDNGVTSGAGYVGADVVDTACARVLVQYRHDQQGIQTVSKAEVFDVGQILGVRLRAGRLSLTPATMPPFVDLDAEDVADGRLVVVVPIAVSVHRLTCS